MTTDDISRRRDPEATRAAILDAAAELFVRDGLADTPTSRIAKKAGVTKSLIHHHFGSKEELWDEIKRRHFERYYEVQKAMLASSEGTIELIRDSMIAYFRFLQSDPSAVRFMSWRFVEQDDPCLGQEEELFALGIERIREAQASGQLRDDVEPLVMIKSFLALSLHWFQTRPFLCQMLGEGLGGDLQPDDPELDERYLRDALEIFLRGVEPR